MVQDFEKRRLLLQNYIYSKFEKEMCCMFYSPSLSQVFVMTFLHRIKFLYQTLAVICTVQSACRV